MTHHKIITNHPDRCVSSLRPAHPALGNRRLTSLAGAPARKTTSAGNEAEHVACQRAGPRASKAGGMKGWMKSWGVAACVVPAASRRRREIKKKIEPYQGEIEALAV